MNKKEFLLLLSIHHDISPIHAFASTDNSPQIHHNRSRSLSSLLSLLLRNTSTFSTSSLNPFYYTHVLYEMEILQDVVGDGRHPGTFVHKPIRYQSFLLAPTKQAGNPFFVFPVTRSICASEGIILADLLGVCRFFDRGLTSTSATSFEYN